MSRQDQFVLRKGLVVHDILSALECENDDETGNEHLIHVEPPTEEAGQATDEDSDKSDEEHVADLNRLGRKLLQSRCKLLQIFMLKNKLKKKKKKKLRQLRNNSDSVTPSTTFNQNSSDDSDDDNEPLFVLKARNPQARTPPAKKKRHSLWKKEVPNFVCTEFTPQSTFEESQNCKNPLDYFKLYFHKTLVEHIVYQTNLYAGQLPQPSLISNYNKNMGGVDKCDQAVAYLRTRMRIRKWWWPILAHFIDVSVVNARFLARKNGCSTETDPSFSFRIFIARSLLFSHGSPPHQGRKPAKPLTSMKFDGKEHWIVPINTERRCADQCGGKSKFKCVKCDVDLHPKCFINYHAPNSS